MSYVIRCLVILGFPACWSWSKFYHPAEMQRNVPDMTGFRVITVILTASTGVYGLICDGHLYKYQHKQYHEISWISSALAMWVSPTGVDLPSRSCPWTIDSVILSTISTFPLWNHLLGRVGPSAADEQRLHARFLSAGPAMTEGGSGSYSGQRQVQVSVPPNWKRRGECEVDSGSPGVISVCSWGTSAQKGHVQIRAFELWVEIRVQGGYNDILNTTGTSCNQYMYKQIKIISYSHSKPVVSWFLREVI